MNNNAAYAKKILSYFIIYCLELRLNYKSVYEYSYVYCLLEALILC